jgi:hypothetical protein
LLICLRKRHSGQPPIILTQVILWLYSIFKAEALDFGGISDKIRKKMIQFIVIQ